MAHTHGPTFISRLFGGIVTGGSVVLGTSVAWCSATFGIGLAVVEGFEEEPKIDLTRPAWAPGVAVKS